MKPSTRFIPCVAVLMACLSDLWAQGPVLARVELQDTPGSYCLPAHAMLQDSGGRDYLLVFASTTDLDRAGWPWRQLGQPASLADVVIAEEMRPGAREGALMQFWPWHDDGRRWILACEDSAVESLAAAGFAVQRLDSTPVVWAPRPDPRLPRRSGSIRLGGDPVPGFDPLVARMLEEVSSTNLWWLMRRLTGEECVMAEQMAYTLTNRHTASAGNIRKATAFVHERFQQLGLNAVFESWSASGYSGRNVLATLPGTSRAGELVLIVAHLDDMPSSGRAPGADDNASGSAGVLAAAGILARHSFERSIRFILFTGEEQGMLGSNISASNSVSSGENIVAVLNLDMIAWDSAAPPVFQLHTRSTNHTSFSNDLAIVTVFTNCVSVYGLTNSLQPRLVPDAISASDHSRYWNRGVPAVLGIEEYGGDFTPHYHKISDTVATLNFPYMTAAVKAALATVSHLAGPVSRSPADLVTLTASDLRSNSGLGSRTFLARHAPGSTESGLEPADLPLDSLPPLTNTWSLAPASTPYGQPLLADCRSIASESDFIVHLAVGGTPGASLTTSNRLRFDFPMPPLRERLYNARVQVWRQYTTNAADFLCVTNLRALAARSGEIQLPSLVNVPVGDQFGKVEISSRFLDTSAARCRLCWAGLEGTAARFETEAQVGAMLVDSIEWTPALNPAQWVPILVATNHVAPTDANFSTGWTSLLHEVDLGSLPAAEQGFFRLSRVWVSE